MPSGPFLQQNTVPAMVEYELQAWEPQLPKAEAHSTPNDSPLQHQEKEEDNVQHSPAQCSQDTDDETTQSSALGSSAHEPVSPKKQSFVRRFWSEQISVVVDFDSCRDHLGVAIAILGTIVAQLFTLQQADSGFGYAMLGKPLATVCYGLSICTTMLGACRAWRLQNAMLRGKAIAGGFEVTSLAVGFLALILIFFGLLIALDIVKESTVK